LIADYERRFRELMPSAADAKDDGSTEVMLAQIRDLLSSTGGTGGVGTDIRYPLCQQFAFAVPNRAALEALTAIGPIVEMGSGGGYWAYLLRRRGVDVVAYDQDPELEYNRYRLTRRWTEVARGRPPILARHADRSLFLCWPGMDGMAAACLRHWRGATVAYIGEGTSGCTGDDDFHARLACDFERMKRVKIPQWPGVHDELEIWRRNGRRKRLANP
jgi:hypothetical protein